MATIVRLHNAAFGTAERLLQDWAIGTLARLVFAGVLLGYFLNSARTKLGEGIGGLFALDVGAYVQILPAQMEAAGYDPAALGLFERLTVYVGTYAELILPLLITVGLFTRLAALGMIVFVIVMTVVDITAHGVDAATVGAWFDVSSGSLIADQRALWMLLFVVLVLKGPGPIALDALLGRTATRG